MFICTNRISTLYFQLNLNLIYKPSQAKLKTAYSSI